jgi:hypothetical protein
MSAFEGTNKPVKAVFAENNCRAIRSSDGLIIRFWKPNKYPGQDERYEQELEETKANQQLVLDAFTVRQQINCELSELLNTLRHIQTISDLGIIKLPEFEKDLINKTLNP